MVMMFGHFNLIPSFLSPPSSNAPFLNTSPSIELPEHVCTLRHVVCLFTWRHLNINKTMMSCLPACLGGRIAISEDKTRQDSYGYVEWEI